jgi:DNA damage-inducible protein 1
MKFGKSFFPVSLTVLDQNDVDFLFGLDMLKRHRCEISLRDNELRIEGGSGTERVQFLSEVDIGKSLGKSNTTLDSSSSEASSTFSGGGGRVSASSAVDPEKLMVLEALGFSEEQSRRALERTGGDVDLAATLLSTNSL